MTTLLVEEKAVKSLAKMEPTGTGRLLRDNIQGITRGGVKCISGLIYEDLISWYFECSWKVIRDTVTN